MNKEFFQKVLGAKRESKHIEFKESIDPSSKQDWCEIIKDLIAIANSGGGAILFGVNNKGVPTGINLSSIKTLDPARIADNIHNYTETHFADFEIHEVEKLGHQLILWIIGNSSFPMVFVTPGTYPIQGGKQRTAFGKGTIYFRHGAKSEPGTSQDIAYSLERKLESIRKDWLGGVRKVINAPVGSQIAVLSPEVLQSSSMDGMPIRIIDDPSVPSYRVVDPDKTHPFRQKELLTEVRKQLPKGVEINQFDILALRNVHKIDAKRDFVHKPKFGSRQYSAACIAWIVSQIVSDPEFLQKVRIKHREPVNLQKCKNLEVKFPRNRC